MQRYIVRLIFMVPLYSILSFLSLMMPKKEMCVPACLLTIVFKVCMKQFGSAAAAVCSAGPVHVLLLWTKVMPITCCQRLGSAVFAVMFGSAVCPQNCR